MKWPGWPFLPPPTHNREPYDTLLSDTMVSPWKPELWKRRAALDPLVRLDEAASEGRMQGCPHPPTPNPHQTLRARAATAAQLAASAVGPTAGAARQPRSSPRKAGVQPGLHVWAYDVPRAACASSGALKRWLAADVATFASIYMELRPARLRGGFLRVPPALRPGWSQRWLNAV